MLLTIDAGNTVISFAIFKFDELVYKFSIPSKLAYESLKNELHLAFANPKLKDNVSSVIIASVVKEVTPILVDSIDKELNLYPHIVTSHSNLSGMQLHIDNPEELGADRICNLFAARSTIQNASIIIDLGTATTFEILDHNLNFIGGIICPGIELGFSSLNKNTSLLPSFTNRTFTDLIGKNTITNITSGIIAGHASMIDGLITRIKEQLDQNYYTIITGGYSSLITPLMKEKVDFIISDLTHIGLNYLYKINS